MQYFPIFLDLNNKAVLVIGGGEVACRKVDMLLRAGANITLVSPQLHKHLDELVQQHQCVWVKSFYQSGMIKDYVQVWATTDNPELNHKIHEDAKRHNIMVNVVDDKPYCDFITPSMINRGRIQVAISSGGSSPVLIRYLREKLEVMLPQNLSLLAEFGACKRNSIKQTLPDVDSRRKFWERFFSHPDVMECSDRTQLESLYQQTLQGQLEVGGSLNWIEYGRDAEMLSLKALHLMQESELVFYPQQCPFEFVDLCRRDADRKCYSDWAQLSLMLAKAKQDKRRVCVFIEKDLQDAQLKMLLAKSTLIRVVE